MSWSAIAAVVRTVLVVAGVALAARSAEALIRCREMFYGDAWDIASESALVSCLNDEIDLAQALLAGVVASGVLWGVWQVYLFARRRSLLAPPAGTFILKD